MASGTNPHLLRLQVHNMSGRSSPHDSHPGTPWHEDDEHAPLLHSHDIDRATYNGTTRSYNFVSRTYCLPFQVIGALTSRPTLSSLRQRHPLPGLRLSTIYPRCTGFQITLFHCMRFSTGSTPVSNCHRCGIPTDLAGI